MVDPKIKDMVNQHKTTKTKHYLEGKLNRVKKLSTKIESVAIKLK